MGAMGPSVPALKVQAAGVGLAVEDLLNLTRLRVHQCLGAPAQCELTFAGARPSLVEPLAVGASLAVGTPAALFLGDVTAVELSHRAQGLLDLRVRAYDVLHRLRKRQPVRVHLELSVAELARELTADLGVSVEAPEDGPVWHHLTQHRQSDLELLVELAARSGLHLALDDHVLSLVTLEGLGPALPLAWGEGLLEADVELNVDQACDSVRAEGWNVRDAEAFSGKAHAPRVSGSMVGSTQAWASPRALVDVGGEADRHVEASAQAELDRRVASQAVLRAVARGDPRLRPATRVRVSGLHPHACGEYALTETIHQVDPEHGYLTRLSSQPPEPRPTRTSAAVSLGVVTRVDSASGRVKVRLSAHGAVETDWVQVATLGAGSGKGLTLLPDVDDVVLLAMAHEDPSEAIVVGSVYGCGGPPDSGVEDSRVQRFTLQTRGGHRISLDDSRKILRLEDSSGSSIDLTADGVTISAKGPLTLDASGQPIVIRGDRVDFRRG